MSLYNFLNKIEEQEILEAIKQAEKNTSGEIRVHIESECKIDAIERAKIIFNHLKMYKTKLRNGVLFYIAADSKHFAIIGDQGINKVVSDDFWEETKKVVLTHFSNQKMGEGLTKGILLAGEQLRTHFPYNSKDKNELSNEISTN